MSEQIKFDDLPESKDTLSIKTAGVHMGFKLDSTEFVEAKITPATAKAKEKKVNAYIKFILKTDTYSFMHFMFSPPVRPEDVKFMSDLYEKGIKIRKRTPEEMITVEFYERYYFYEQLAKAWNSSPEKLKSFKKQIGGEIDEMFRNMYDKFFATYPKDYWKDRKINFKTMWNNNDKARTSNLNLCRAEANNVVFAPYINDSTPVLQLSDWEEKNSARKYKPQDKAPDTNAADAGAANEDTNWKPATEDEKGADDLF